MEVIYQNNLKFENIKTAICLGNFDGIHIGHEKLIKTLVKKAKDKKLISIVYTFDEHTLNLITGNLINKLIINNNEKSNLIKDLGVDYLYLEKFTEEFSKMHPEVFVREILHKKLNVKLMVVGFNYKFGFKGEGNVKLLKELSKIYDFELIIVPAFKIDEIVVSSTVLRKYIVEGQMDKVKKLLGRYFSIKGIVESGKQRGRTIGFKTANIRREKENIVPALGTYATRTEVNEKTYNSITNIGINPTFEENVEIKIETHIFEFSEEIYEKEIEVFFVQKIRDEKKFNYVEELVSQIHIDIDDAKKILIKVR